jgi:hypothetical protein
MSWASCLCSKVFIATAWSLFEVFITWSSCSLAQVHPWIHRTKTMYTSKQHSPIDHVVTQSPKSLMALARCHFPYSYIRALFMVSYGKCACPSNANPSFGLPSMVVVSSPNICSVMVSLLLPIALCDQHPETVSHLLLGRLQGCECCFQLVQPTCHLNLKRNQDDNLAK